MEKDDGLGYLGECPFCGMLMSRNPKRTAIVKLLRMEQRVHVRCAGIIHERAGRNVLMAARRIVEKNKMPRQSRVAEQMR